MGARRRCDARGCLGAPQIEHRVSTLSREARLRSARKGWREPRPFGDLRLPSNHLCPRANGPQDGRLRSRTTSNPARRVAQYGWPRARSLGRNLARTVCMECPWTPRVPSTPMRRAHHLRHQRPSRLPSVRGSSRGLDCGASIFCSLAQILPEVDLLRVCWSCRAEHILDLLEQRQQLRHRRVGDLRSAH